MAKHWWRVIAGLFIVIVGVLLLLAQLGWVVLQGAMWGSLALLAGAVIFGSLWLSNPTEWWPLIPGCILLGWGIGLLFDVLGLPGWLVQLVGFAGSALPFFYLFFQQGAKEGWWALIPAGILSAWGVGSLLDGLGLPEMLVTLVGFEGSAVPFLMIFAMNRRKNWWALIPGGVMAFMGLVMALGQWLGEEWIPTLILFGIAAVFVVVFVVDRHNWWALIPAGVLLVVGIAVGPLGATIWMP
ncbi:MAG: hypothetical protein ACUVR2_11765, partial [Anaerolineae bacterium]